MGLLYSLLLCEVTRGTQDNNRHVLLQLNIPNVKRSGRGQGAVLAMGMGIDGGSVHGGHDHDRSKSNSKYKPGVQNTNGDRQLLLLTYYKHNCPIRVDWEPLGALGREALVDDGGGGDGMLRDW